MTGSATADIARRRTLLHERYPHWVPRTIIQQLTATARSFPNRPYLLAGDQSVSYAQLRSRARELAAGLMAAGVEPGEHVATVLANYPEFVVVKYAIAAAGAVAVPLNFRLRTEELHYVLRQSTSVALVTMDRFRDLDYLAMLDDMAPGWQRGPTGELPDLRRVYLVPTAGEYPRSPAPTLAELAAGGRSVSARQLDALERRGDPSAVADLIYTSGTTGKPKGVMLSHDNVLRCAASSAFIRALRPGQRVLSALPLHHVFAYVEGLLAVTYAGGAFAPQVDFTPESTFEAIERLSIDEVLLVPTMTVAALEHPSQRDHDLSSLREVMSAAAPAPLYVWRQLRQQWGITEIVTAYGQTEVAASATYTLPEDPLELVSTTVGKPKPGFVAGVPELGGDVAAYKTVDPITGADLAPGAEGELAVTGPQVMRGYYRMPAETAAVLDGDGWLRSGDLGRIRPDGYLVLTGRSKDLYKRGGELVSPREVEDFLTARPNIAQAFVIGVPDPRWGETGCVFVVRSPGSEITGADVIDLCRAHLARFKVPERVIFVDAEELPTTSTGKVQKYRLAELAGTREMRPT